MDLIPKKVICCKKKRRQRALEKARNELASEINIIDIVKSRRLIHWAIRELLTKSQRVRLQEKTSYFEIDPDSGSNGNERKSERYKLGHDKSWHDDSMKSDLGADDRQPPFALVSQDLTG